MLKKGDKLPGLNLKNASDEYIFILDETGTVTKAFPKVKAAGHAAEILALL